jgi:hypothetical protein
MADIMFDSKMTSFNVVVKKDNIFTSFNLQVVEDSSVRKFPQQFKYPDLTSVFSSNALDDVFDKISIPCSDYLVEYDMKIGDLEFVAKLDTISAVVKREKDGTAYTVYNLRYIKELDKDVDPKLSTFLKVKEVDIETGKKTDKFFPTEMTVKE